MSLPARAWGPDGHQIVVYVAEQDLSEATKAEICALLGGDSLAEVAEWADNITKQRPESRPWHYVNLPPDAVSFDRRRDCPDGDCVVGAVERFAAVLSDATASRQQRKEALKFLIHFVADVHQPMHCGRAADRGGNEIHLQCLGRRINLHLLWDITLFERQKMDPRIYAAELLYDITAADRTAWLRSRPEDWASESWQLSQTYAYRSPLGRPLRSGDRIGRTYLDIAQLITDRQLARAGVRLAGVLNEAMASYRAGRAAATRPAGVP